MEAIKKSEVTARVIDVTPFMAQNWLSQNPSNRSVSHQRVDAYAHDMKNGDWKMNGEPIVIDSVGQLKNGQHRLHAVVKSGSTVPMLVVFGVDPSVTLYDRGRARSAIDILRISGFDKELSNSAVVGCARLDRFVRHGESYTGDAETERWILTHENAIRVANRACALASRTNGRVNTRTTPMMLATVYAYEAGVSEQALCEFAEAVRTGIVSGDCSTSAVVLRNDMLSRAAKSYGTRDRVQMLIMAERAIYDYVNGVSRRKSYWGTKDHMYMGVALCNS